MTVSPRLDGLVTGRIARTYLDAIDGFWADVVLRECGLLERRGLALQPIFFHQNGDAVAYKGPPGLVRFELMPDASWIAASAILHGGFQSFDGDLDVLARIWRPSVEPPPRSPLNEANVAATVRFWAGAIEAAADQLLG